MDKPERGFPNQMEFLSLPDRPKPRSEGVTVMSDTFVSMRDVEGLLETQSETLDYAKIVHAGLFFGESLPPGWIRRKIELYRSKGIKTYPGGVPYQVALVHREQKQFFDWVKGMGFDGVEIAEDAINFPAPTPKSRADDIKMALDKGLFVDTELGKKLPDAPMDLVEAYDVMMADLELGVHRVVIERSELDYFIDKNPAPLVDLVNRVGLKNVILEPGPYGFPKYHLWCLKVFGPKANLSNIDKRSSSPCSRDCCRNTLLRHRRSTSIFG
ncbi:hypothetical protein BH10PSE7_BH10PSE7_04960 [soil metagenome]